MLGKTLRATIKNSGMGVPQKLPLGELLLLVTLFAVLFRLLTLLPNVPGELVLVVGALTIGVSLAQAFLFNGERPRLASLIAGTFLCPMLLLAIWIGGMVGVVGYTFGVGPLVSGLVFLTLAGPLLGYFAGLFVAGWFFLFDYNRSEFTGKPRRYDQIVEERARNQSSTSGDNEQVTGQVAESRLALAFKTVTGWLNPYQPTRPVRGAVGAFLLTIALGLMIGPLTPFGIWAAATVLGLSVVAAIATGCFQYRWHVPTIAIILCAIAGAVVYSQFLKIQFVKYRFAPPGPELAGLGLGLLCILGGLLVIAIFGWFRSFTSSRKNAESKLAVPGRPRIVTAIAWLVLASLVPGGLMWFFSAFQSSPRESIAARITQRGGKVDYVPIPAAVRSWPPKVQSVSFAKDANEDLPMFLDSHPESIWGITISDPEFDERHLQLLDGRRVLSLIIQNGSLTGKVFEDMSDLSTQYLQFLDCPLSDEGLQNVTSLPENRRMTKYLILDDTNCEKLSGMDNLRGLTWFKISGDKFTGEAVEWQAPLKASSCFFQCPITDAGLQKLAALLPNVSQLTLEETKLTDEGLRHLAGFKSLRQIHLSGENITDAAVEALSGLKTPIDISLLDTSVTKEAMERFAKEHPESSISD